MRVCDFSGSDKMDSDTKGHVTCTYQVSKLAKAQREREKEKLTASDHGREKQG